VNVFHLIVGSTYLLEKWVVFPVVVDGFISTSSNARYMSEGRDIEELLSERPDLESALENVLDVDESGEPWTYDDLSIDSGQFGELVSHGVVKETEDGYRVSNPDAVRDALGDEQATGSAERELDVSLPEMPSIERRVLAALVGALVLVVIFRAYHYESIFRNGVIVLSGNDPYYYRYWLEQMLTTGSGSFDLTAVNLPSGVKNGEPLLITTLWAVAALFGGTKTTAGWVLAWYPVFAALVVGILTYLTAVNLTKDRRIAIAAVVLLAVTPAHALRTSLGFADHHAFDYVWLAVTIYGLTILSSRETPFIDTRSWLPAGLLGVGVAGQILAWEAGPLLLLPIGIYVGLGLLIDLREDKEPIQGSGPLVAGLSIGAGLVLLAHFFLGWHSTLVAFAPLLLTAGVMSLLLAGFVSSRFGLSVVAFVTIGVSIPVIALTLLRMLQPALFSELLGELNRLTANGRIAETQSLLSGDSFGWLLLFGFVLVLALPYLAWVTVRAYRGRTDWLAVTAYGWFLLALAMFQVRFAGELSLVIALFGGIGFVHLSERVDLARRPFLFDETKLGVDGPGHAIEIPTPRNVAALLVLFVLVGGLGMVQTPVKINQVTIDGRTYQTATWLSDYTTSLNLTYPENYIFSPWSQNRVYNYFVNGESESFGYAQRNYLPFANSTNEREWYHRLSRRTNIVVTQNNPSLGEGTIWARLHERYGSASETERGAGHFRAIYASEDGSRKVFELVPGANITGRAEPNSTVIVRTTVQVPNAEFDYWRQTRTTMDGHYVVRVPYSGNYQTGDENQAVSAHAVESGQFVGDRAGRATWQLEAGRGGVAFDSVSNYHGRVTGAEWVRTGGDMSLAFDPTGPGNENGYGDDTVTVGNVRNLTAPNELNVSVRFQTAEGVDYLENTTTPRLLSTTTPGPFAEAAGYQIALISGQLVASMGNTDERVLLRGPQVTDARFHRVRLAWDGTQTYLILDGDVVDTASFDGSVTQRNSLSIGATSNGLHGFRGYIEDAQINTSYPSIRSGGGISANVSDRALERDLFVGDRAGRAMWRFEAGRGNSTHCRRRAYHGRIDGAEWARTNTETSLAFDPNPSNGDYGHGEDSVVVDDAGDLTGPDALNLSVRFRTAEGINYNNQTEAPRLVSTTSYGRLPDTAGFQMSLTGGDLAASIGDGNNSVVLVGPRVDDDQWHRVRLSWNGSRAQLYLDGTIVDTGYFQGTLEEHPQLYIGNSAGGRRGYRGYIDDVRLNTSVGR